MRRQPPRHARRAYLVPALLIASLAAACIAGGSGAASANGLVGAYSFDAGAGTSVADNSGAANTGTLSGATWVTGKTGKALSFDGVNDWVTIADSASLDLSSAMTLEAWVKPQGGGWRTVALKERSGGLAYALYSSTNNGRPSAEVRTSGGYETSGPAKLASGVWSHLATTFNGSTLRLYVNGAQVASQPATGGMVNSSSPLRIGGNAVWSEWFSGQIDDLRIYNRALTTAELQTDMNTPVGGAAPPPPPPPPPADSQAPTAPSGLTAGGQSQTQITLSWNASSDNVGVTGYSRYQDGTLVSSATGTSFSFTGLACGTSYTLAVDAYDAAGNRSSRPSISASTLPCPAGASPVAAYSFDAVAGTSLTDNSGSGNTGTITGATWTSAGKSGGALAFDGVNDIVTVADKASLDLSTAMTLEAWVRPTSNSTWRTIVTKETSGNLTYGLFSNSDAPQPSAIVSIGANPIQDITRGPTEVAMSGWTHLASTYDGATLRLYVNGNEVSTTNVTGAMANSAGPLQIGGNNIWAEWFQGQIDDLRIYNRALTPSQLQSDMNTAVTPPPAGDTQAPSAPTGLAVSGQTQTALTLSWNASTDNVGVSGYSTYRNTAAAGTTAPATRTYTFTGLTCGTAYSLGVDAVDAAGNRSGQATASGTTNACPAGDTQAPSAPTGLAVSGQTQTALTLSWNASTDNVGVSGYSTYRNTAAAGTTAPATRTYTFTGLTCGTAYSLGVDAVDAAGNRSGQATASGTTNACPAGDTQAPSAPTGLAVSGQTQTALTLSWNASTDNVGVSGYSRYRDGNLVSSGTGTSFAFTGLLCGTSYTLAVDAYDAAGNRSTRQSTTAATTACSAGGSASVYLSPSGSDSNACTQAAPCKSFDRGYRVAAPGGVVEVAGGSYAAQTLTTDSSKTSSSDVVFRPATGASVVLGDLTVLGDHIEIRDMRVTSSVATKTTTDDVTLRNIDMLGFFIEGSSNVSVIGGRVHCGVCDYHSQISAEYGVNVAPTNLLFDGVLFEDWQSASAAQHTECLQIGGGNGITIRNSTFRQCATATPGSATASIHISWYGTGTITKNVLLENNFIYASGNAFTIQANDFDNLDLRYNSIAGPIVIFNRDGGGTGMDFIGNILTYSFETCTAENSGVPINWRYNVMNGGTCGATDRNAPNGYVNSNSDLHLTPGSAANGAGDPATYPTTDIDGNSRSSAPDAGADER